MNRKPHQFDPKRVAEIYVVGIDFAALTATPSAPAVTAEWLEGTADATPAAMLQGAATVTGSVVTQKLVGGVSGAAYRLLFQADAPDGSRYIEEALLRVT
jgi:hypothetical protein